MIQKLNFTHTFYKRYVDDCFIDMRNDKMNYTANMINISYIKNPNFTVKKIIKK